jgi:hypothetical protein
MQKKLNEDFIESFSEQFAAKISDDFFASNTFINGQEILNITPSKQVNFFIIKLLFNNWQLESQRLESPFFDYTAPEVKEAMLQFMNVLSRHIRVGRKEFEILVQDAVRDTLFLIMAPNVYMEIEMDRRGTEELTEKTAKNILKYLKISKDQFSDYLLDNVGLDRDEIDIHDTIISEQQLLDEIALLNEVVPITLKLLEEGEEDEIGFENNVEEEDEDSLLNVEPEDVFKAPIEMETPKVEQSDESESTEKKEVEEEKIETPESDPIPSKEESEELKDPEESSLEMDETDAPEEESPVLETPEAEEPEKAIAEEPVVESIPEEENESEDLEPEDEEEEPEKEETRVTSKWDVRATSDNIEDEEAESTGNNEPKEVITNIDPDDEEDEDEDDTLNAKFEDPTSPASIAEAHENQVDSMMNAISLNQRFMFINELFDGDPEIFKESIDMVDGCSSFDESVEKLVQNYARDFHWDMNSEEVKELLKIIFRRFR